MTIVWRRRDETLDGGPWRLLDPDTPDEDRTYGRVWPIFAGERGEYELTHAQVIRLAWSIELGAPVERPAIVACRYTGQTCD